jgi:hypothetical protein
MSGPGIAIKLLKRFANSGAHRVEMDIPNEFPDLVLVLRDNGFETIHEQRTPALIFLIAKLGKPHIQRLHNAPEVLVAVANDKVIVIGHERPSVTAAAGFANTEIEQTKKSFPILVVTKEPLPVQATGHSMRYCSGNGKRALRGLW